MKIKKIIDVYGREFEVDEETRKVVDFSNKERRVTYNAQTVVDGCGSRFWTDYTEKGVVDDIRTKIEVWNSKLYLIYAKHVRYRASINDPDGSKLESFCQYVERNNDRFFDEFGDYRKDFLISEDEIKGIFL